MDIFFSVISLWGTLILTGIATCFIVFVLIALTALCTTKEKFVLATLLAIPAGVLSFIAKITLSLGVILGIIKLIISLL